MTLLKKYKTGWWLVELNGRVGRVPGMIFEYFGFNEKSQFCRGA